MYYINMMNTLKIQEVNGNNCDQNDPIMNS